MIFPAINRSFTANLQKVGFGWQVVIVDDFSRREVYWSGVNRKSYAKRELNELVAKFQGDKFFQDLLRSRI